MFYNVHVAVLYILYVCGNCDYFDKMTEFYYYEYNLANIVKFYRKYSLAGECILENEFN